MQTRVPLRVDQRRRRRRILRLQRAAAAAVLATGASVGFWQLWPAGSVAGAPGPALAAARPKQQAAVPARKQRVVATRRAALVTGPALSQASLSVTARAAIVIDTRDGRVVWARRAHARELIASTTKIMTAILSMEKLAPRDLVTVGRSVPRVEPNREGLRVGERVPAWKLEYGLMLYSGNDDALALAIASAGSRAAFLRLMNEKAHTLGLTGTHFTTPSGVIDDDNYSTAWDMAALSRYAMRSPRFRAVVRTRVAHVKWAPPTYAKTYVNHNQLLADYRGADGIKTGWTTRASHCLVASAQRGSTRLIAVVLHSSDVYGDARRLLDYGFTLAGTRG
jgi:D-alanyl-D-alanine carboxypeptidase (penicillin-binding protein 5/6)